MIALLDPAGTTTARFSRTDLKTGLKEQWLQELLFTQPDLIPYDEIEPGAGVVIPICRELSLPKPGGSVFLDMLGVARNGRLVLVECKLWRNPQARREVVAQILEYAALLRSWSYADLTARLKTKLEWSGANPLYDHAVAHGSDLEEAAFADAVARSLATGDFDLIVAGDGIRADMAAIAEHLQYQGARLSLVEFQVWRDTGGQTLVVPQIPFRSEVIRQQILVDAAGAAVQVEDPEDDDVEASVDPDAAARKADIRAFWQKFIDEVSFDHPDQPRPRHGGTNYVRIPLPGATSLTAYRTATGLMGVFLSGKGKAEAYALLEADEDTLRAEPGLEDLRFHALGKPDQRDVVAIDTSRADPVDEAKELAWFKDMANRMVNALRPRLAGLGER